MNRAKKLQKRLEKIRTKRSMPKYQVIDFPNLSSYVPPHELSNRIDGLCANKDKLFSHRWRKGQAKETPHTVKEIEKKAKRIRPLYGKGNYQFSTDGDNTGTINIYKKGA